MAESKQDLGTRQRDNNNSEVNTNGNEKSGMAAASGGFTLGPYLSEARSQPVSERAVAAVAGAGAEFSS